MAAIDGKPPSTQKQLGKAQSAGCQRQGAGGLGSEEPRGSTPPEVGFTGFCLPVGKNPVSTLVEPTFSPLKANR